MFVGAYIKIIIIFSTTFNLSEVSSSTIEDSLSIIKCVPLLGEHEAVVAMSSLGRILVFHTPETFLPP